MPVLLIRILGLCHYALVYLAATCVLAGHHGYDELALTSQKRG